MPGAFGMFAWAISRGHSVEAARTLVVNTIVAMEIFHLFSVRYLDAPSLAWRGLLGTPAVLLGVGAVLLGRLAFTIRTGRRASPAPTSRAAPGTR